MTASSKVHQSRVSRDCAAPFPAFQRGRLIAAYYYVRLIPQSLHTLHLDLFTVPSHWMTYYEGVGT